MKALSHLHLTDTCLDERRGKEEEKREKREREIRKILPLLDVGMSSQD